MTAATHRSSSAGVFECLALVDLFNVVSAPKTERDYEELLDLVAGLITRKLEPAASDVVVEVTCRLYGGFTDRVGGNTDQYSLTAKKLRNLRTRERRVSIRPELAVSMAGLRGVRLVGTYKNKKQKMVDQMLAQDLMFYANGRDFDSILLIGDDEDYVPAVLSASSAEPDLDLRWLRFQSERLNDHHFSYGNVTFLTDEEWVR